MAFGQDDKLDVSGTVENLKKAQAVSERWPVASGLDFLAKDFRSRAVSVALPLPSVSRHGSHDRFLGGKTTFLGSVSRAT